MVLNAAQKCELAIAVDIEFNRKVKAITNRKMDFKASEIRNYFYGRCNTQRFNNVDERMIYAYTEMYKQFPGMYGLRPLSDLMTGVPR